MTTQYDRSQLLIGETGLQKLRQAHVAIAGIGGVGSYVAEALARAGIGRLTLIDHDVIDVTNLNRQIHALHSTIGQAKVTVMQERIADIDPDIDVIAKTDFILPENIDKVFNESYNYLIDAIDTITSKLAIILWAKTHQIPIICSMGTANKLDNRQFILTDISQTKVCPLVKIMRHELRKRGIEQDVTVLYSPSAVIKPQDNKEMQKKRTAGSISYVPATAGLLIAGEVVRQLLNNN